MGLAAFRTLLQFATPKGNARFAETGHSWSLLSPRYNAQAVGQPGTSGSAPEKVSPAVRSSTRDEQRSGGFRDTS